MRVASILQKIRRASAVFGKPLALIAAAAVLGAGARPASAEDWPTKPINLVASFTAGGMMDFIGRTIVQDLSPALGQPVIVDFKSGGGGVVGLQWLAKQPADGYTLMMTATGPLVFRPLIDKKVGYDAEKDFTPIILIGDTPNAVMASPKHGFKTIKDLLDYVNTKSNKLTIGHPGPGTMGHLCGVLLARKAHIDPTFVAYRGAAGIITDLMGGQIDLATPAYGPGMDKLTLALSSDERLKSQPDLPTLKESGVDVVCSTWIAIHAPAHVPPAIVNKLNAAIDAFLRKPETHAKFGTIGLRVLGGPPDRMRARIKEDLAKWTDIVAGVNFDLPK